MKYPREEQETIIRKGALDDHWEVYTSDSVMMTKLDKLVEASSEWTQTGVQKCQGDICGKEYECSGNLVSFRTATKKTAPLSDEEKTELAARFKHTK